MNHNDRLAEIQLKICQLIRTGLGKLKAPMGKFHYLLTTFHAATAARAELEMEYVQCDRLLVDAHGVDIVGWPKDVLFATPSKISRVADLNKLYTALSEGTCHWV